MKVLNFGSLNLDYVYFLDHIVKPGETISSQSLEVFCGGKGLNQSIALAKAGASVCHGGMVGPDGGMLLDICTENNIDISRIAKIEERSGNAIIQVSSDGQNSIVLFGGANRKNSKTHVEKVLADFQKGDMLLLQNEINLLDYIIERAYEKGLTIALNPSPYDKALDACDLSKVSIFLLNEVEGEQITGQKQPDEILDRMKELFPNAKTVLTLGKKGAVYSDANIRLSHGVYDVPVVDTTAAGDTFTGYFLTSLTKGDSPERALELASAASSLAVSKKGAASSIPTVNEVLQWLKK